MCIPILVLKIYTYYLHIHILLTNKKVNQFLTKSQTSGRDISKNVTNIGKKFSMILIDMKMIILTKFHFCGNVHLIDPRGL